MNVSNLKYRKETAILIGRAMEVHNILGCGFQEKIYQRSFAIELELNSIPFKREFEMSIFYKGNHIGTRRVDFLINDNISVELKAVSGIEPIHYTQAINYLEAYNLEVGLLINFGAKSLEFKRVYNSKFNRNFKNTLEQNKI